VSWQTVGVEASTTPDQVDLSDLSFDQLLELQRRLDAAATGGDDGRNDGGDDGGDGGDEEDGGGPGVVVLPWWQHPVNILTMLVTATLIAGMIGWMIGDDSGRAPHNQVDTGFLQDMRLHHEQALDMSRRYLGDPDIDPGLAVVASSIIQGQTIEIGRMVQMLRFFGEPESNEGDTSMAWMNHVSEVGMMPGMASDGQLDQLGDAAGLAADQMFVDLMTAHHLGGVHMAEYAAEHAASPEVRAMASAIVNAQLAEIVEMRGQLG
jgi:uncharacterized protein (DUF305 family)